MTTGGTYRNNQQYFQFKVNNSTKKRNLSAQVALVRNETPSNGSDELLDYSGHYTRSVHSSDGKNEKSLSPSARLYGDFNLGKNQTLEVTARGSYTRNDYTRLYTEDQEQSLTDVTEDFYSFRASAKYNIQLKHNNSFGVNISHDHQVTSSSYAGDYASWQHLWMGESSFLLNYTQKFGEHFLMVLRPGLSWINYKLHSENIRRYLSLRTSSRFSYNFNRKQSLMLMCDVGANQPEISYINNVDQTVDFLQIKRGNPLLDDMSMYNVTLMYNGIFGRLNIAGGVGYSIYKNNIVPDYYIEGDKLINSYRSDGNIYGLGVQLLASYRITDNLRTKLTFKYLNEQTKKNKAPAWALTEIAIEKGEQLANQYHVDKDLVLISLYLQHTVFSRVYKGEIQKNHPQLSAEFSKKYLEEWGVSEKDKKVILNAIEAHHNAIKATSLVAEVVKNAECFKFVTVKGALIWLHELGLRGVSYEESVERVIEKMEQKKKLLTLSACIEEAEKNCKDIIQIFSL